MNLFVLDCLTINFLRTCIFGGLFGLRSILSLCGCIWAYLADLRNTEGKSHVHYNLFYDDAKKHDCPLLPPAAAALSPTLWPQIHLRWAGQLEARCRNMSLKFSELQKAKEAAERKAKQVSDVVDSLTSDLHRDRRLNNSAVNLAKKATRENAAIKRDVQSFGCKVHISSSGDCTVDLENCPFSSPQKSMLSSLRRESNGSYGHDEKSDLSVSITVVADDISSNGSPADLCQGLCPMLK